MSAKTVNATTAQERLVAKAARKRVDERELERAIYQAANHAGLSQRQISDIVGIHSQATVQRILRRLTEDPSLLDETPAEIIDRRAAGMIGDRSMMERLLNWKYSFGGVVRIDGVATDAYTTGDWDDIEMAFYRGLLSDDEFQALAARHLKSI
ncbi:winged helix-turn-helix domain-containing protein [Mycobacterium malmoense]|uniref:Winged helix-turn-helix domain-containing protein n=1 Tax=Mycobacterium malmoense TaxID=1780 RepID=A0ABX3SUB8_MYCMA|nr:winged helix-turn-helix domain-containing protein [Mycobacterium malmoense]OIN78874.1 winged helix-turn-helix domain-containing protein [Mycobacterium malmoense]ORA83731.1 winged helix-turn-helix domain-containing protein [Mycobacterium malmoense]QZA18845.1 winged helix-turn-helix domain-containing protein [Mycobacterium malmoense]UNB95616.1 winged helix-turn-helix domain-containing protein [Mycobacterium malmoense]